MAAAEEREKLPIPSMTIDDAVALIGSFAKNIVLSEEDIKRPQCQTLRKWYHSILIDQLGIAQERLVQPHFSSMTELEHPELHEDSGSLLIFTLALQRFMYACGIEDFTVHDILSPSPKRTLHHISAVLNFMKFKTFQKDPYDTIMEELDSVGERRHQALERNAALRQRIDQLRVQRAEEEAQAEQITPAVEALEATIRELNREQAAETKKYQQLKTTSAEQATKRAEIKVSLINLKSSCDNLKSRIVQSPDRFKAEMSRLTKQLDHCKSNIDEKCRRLTELDNQKDGRQKWNENVKNALKLMKCISTDMERENELLGQREERQDKCRAQKETLKDLALKIQHCKRQAASKQDKMFRNARQHEKKIAALNEQSHDLKRDEARYIETNVGESMETCKDVDRKMQDMVHMIEDKENQSNKELAALRQSYSNLIEQVGVYHQGLNEAWSGLLEQTA